MTYNEYQKLKRDVKEAYQSDQKVIKLHREFWNFSVLIATLVDIGLYCGSSWIKTSDFKEILLLVEPLVYLISFGCLLIHGFSNVDKGSLSTGKFPRILPQRIIYNTLSLLTITILLNVRFELPLWKSLALTPVGVLVLFLVWFSQNTRPLRFPEKDTFYSSSWVGYHEEIEAAGIDESKLPKLGYRPSGVLLTDWIALRKDLLAEGVNISKKKG